MIKKVVSGVDRVYNTLRQKLAWTKVLNCPAGSDKQLLTPITLQLKNAEVDRDYNAIQE